MTDVGHPSPRPRPGPTPIGILDRFWASAEFASVATIMATSEIDLSIGWFAGWPALAVSLLFLALLAGIIARPGLPALYLTTAVVGALWFLGRGLAFAQLATHGHPHLYGSAVSAAVGQSVAHGALCLKATWIAIYRRDLGIRHREDRPRSWGESRE